MPPPRPRAAVSVWVLYGSCTPRPCPVELGRSRCLALSDRWASASQLTRATCTAHGPPGAPLMDSAAWPPLARRPPVHEGLLSLKDDGRQPSTHSRIRLSCTNETCSCPSSESCLHEVVRVANNAEAAESHLLSRGRHAQNPATTADAIPAASVVLVGSAFRPPMAPTRLHCLSQPGPSSVLAQSPRGISLEPTFLLARC